VRPLRGRVVTLAGTLRRARTHYREPVRAYAPVSGNPRVNAPTQAPLRVTHATP